MNYAMDMLNYIIQYLPFIILFVFIAVVLFDDKKFNSYYIMLTCYFLCEAITSQYKIPYSNPTEYIIKYKELEMGLMRLSGAFAIMFTIILRVNKQAKYQAILLACLVFVHSMVIYHLQSDRSWLSSFIYSYCDELTIIIWLAMMAIARDGLIKAFNNISLLLRKHNVYCFRNSSYIHRKSKGKGGT